MEFSARLKELREKNGVSQQELANAIFVSRSAVAKWENGLGLPSESSYRALLAYFGVTNEEFPLYAVREAATVSKNKTIRKLSWCVAALLLVVSLIFPLFLIAAVADGFGFTSAAAAGKAWQDNACIHTSEYDFYYDGILIKYSAETGDGGTVQSIERLCVVENQLIGYKKIDTEAFRRTVYAENGEGIGYLYAFPGKSVYYYFFISFKIASLDQGVRIYLFDEIKIKEETLSLLQYSYFTYPFEITSFCAYGVTYTVG